MSNSIFLLSWMLGLILAPHTLSLLGNLAGSYQFFFLMWLVFATGLHWINLRSAHQIALFSQASHPNDRTPILTILLLASRTTVTLALSTVLLVTAGFVFNETFIYWFPNFAFAFILLGVVLAVHLWGGHAAIKLQVGAVSIVLLGLVSLIILGLFGVHGQEGGAIGLTTTYPLKGLASSLLLLIGFDLVISSKAPKQIIEVRPIQWALLSAAMLIGLWGWVCLRYVPGAKLADSFIPHILAARAVQGDVGRAIMGAVVIAGSLAAVNTLFRSLTELLSGLKTWHCLEGGARRLVVFQRPAVWHVLIAVAIGLMMAGGVAGSDEIDLYVRAGLIIWLLYYGGLNLSVVSRNLREPNPVDWYGRLMPTIGAVFMGLSGIVLLMVDPDGRFLVKSFIIIGIFGAVTAFLGFLLKKALCSDMKYRFHRQK